MTGEGPLAFVLMPFEAEFDTIYGELIRPAMEAAGYRVLRADSFLEQRNIMMDVVRGIDMASLIVAELTSLNPNVLYELGLAHGLRKPTVILTQDISELPFDLRSYRVVPYSTRFDEVGVLRTVLEEIASAHRRGESDFGNPVTDFAPSAQPKAATDEASEAGAGALEDEPAGMYDFLQDSLQAMERLGEIAAEFGTLTESLGASLDGRAKEMEEAKARSGAGQAARFMRIMRDTARDIHSFADKTAGLLAENEGAWEALRDSTVGLLEVSVIETPEDLASVVEFKTVIAGLRENLLGARDSSDGMRQSMSQLREQRFSRDLNRALRKGEHSVEEFINQMTVGDSYLARIINVVDEKAGEPSSDGAAPDAQVSE